MDNDISPQGYVSPLWNQAKAVQDKRADAEKNDTLAQLPLLKQVVKRLDNRIAETDSVKKALVLADKYELTREESLVVMDVVRQLLEAEKGFIVTRVNRTK